MKTFIFLALIAAAAYGFLKLSPFFIMGSYESIEYGVKFSFPSFMVANERPESDMLEVKKASQPEGAPFVFFKKYKNDAGVPLSYRIPVEFGKGMLDERPVSENGISGISFEWQGAKGLERAFAFESSDRDYVMSTSGLPDKDIEGLFDTMLGSLSVTYK